MSGIRIPTVTLINLTISEVILIPDHSPTVYITLKIWYSGGYGMVDIQVVKVCLLTVVPFSSVSITLDIRMNPCLNF